MAWDFSTEREFEERLGWVETFVREEVWPIEAILDELSREQLDDGAERRGLGSDAAATARSPRGWRVRHPGPQVVQVQRFPRGLPDRNGRDRSAGAPAPARVDVHRAGRCAGREHRARHLDDGA